MLKWKATIAILIIFSLFVALSTLTFFFNRGSLPQIAGADLSAEQFLDSFLKDRKPTLELALSSLYNANSRVELLDPVVNLQSLSFRGEHATTCQPNRSIKNDEGTVPEDFSCNGGQGQGSAFGFPINAKERMLETYEFNSWVPSESFVSTPPFVAQNGHSFAYAIVSLIPFDRRKSWVEDHLVFFKPSELLPLLSTFQIENPEFKAIGSLSENEINQIVAGARVVLTDKFILIRNLSDLGFSRLSYWLYDIRDLQSFQEKSKFELIPAGEGGTCIESIGNACWTYNSKTTISYLYKYSQILLLALGISLLALIALFLQKQRSRIRDQERHRFSMQVLSHEFRTPVSSLLLLVDKLSQSSGAENEEQVELIARAASEVYRLQRVIEMGRSYVESSSSRKKFRLQEIPSINQWVEEVALELDPRIQCELLPVDQKIQADHFWLKFVISNLVSNAFAHGAEPVWIRLKDFNKKIKISVEDGGECEVSEIRKMTQAFFKSSESQGMGLGLNIVDQIVRGFKSKLEFEANPSRFSFNLELFSSSAADQ